MNERAEICGPAGASDLEGFKAILAVLRAFSVISMGHGVKAGWNI